MMVPIGNNLGRVGSADQALAVPATPLRVDGPSGFDPSRCLDCGGPNPVWFVANAVWNFVMGGPDARDDPGGYCCPVCFIARAEASGVQPTAWELAPEDRGTLLAKVRDLLVWATKRGLTQREAKCALAALDERATLATAAGTATDREAGMAEGKGAGLAEATPSTGIATQSTGETKEEPQS